MELKWRFPQIKGGIEQGLTSGDKEIFKKKPYASFAREILQNSIDVPLSDEEPVIVEFNSFSISKDQIPDRENLRKQIERCKRYWISQEEIVKKYDSMLEEIDKENLECLRISDFNTTGLTGIYSTEKKDNRFKALIKSTGVSVKGNDNAGGSKGVGKNAMFLLSNLFLALFTTYTKDGDEGSAGVANFISGFVNDTDDESTNTFTQGQGFFSDSDDNGAVKYDFNLDPKYHRGQRTGTDIYVIGFRKHENWDKEIIKSIVESFFVAIYRNKLKIIIDGVEISKDTLEDIVYNGDYFTEKERCNAISSYMLVSNVDGNVQTFDVDTNYGKADLFILPLSKDNEKYATHRCDMIRFPYMSIKPLSLNRSFRVSAMCIIGNDTLGKTLRSVENPEHTNWEPKRIEDPDLSREVQELIASIKQIIEDDVNKVMMVGDGSTIDPNKAGEFLPSIDAGNAASNQGEDETEGNSKHKSTSSNVKRRKPLAPSADVESPNGIGTEPDIGAIEEDHDGDVTFPTGENSGSGGDVKPGEGKGNKTDGDGIILRNVDGSPVKYKLLCLNQLGDYKLVFTSPTSNQLCYLKLLLVDDAGNKFPVALKEIYANGNKINVTGDNEFGPFEINRNRKCVLTIKTETQKGNFASEVKIICK